MSPSTLASLEEKGAVSVTKLLAQGQYGEPGSRLWEDIKTWLGAKNLEGAERAESRDTRSIDMASRAIAIAEEANRIASSELVEARKSADSAREQARWAKWAAVIATIAAAIAAKENIVSFIFGTS